MNRNDSVAGWIARHTPDPHEWWRLLPGTIRERIWLVAWLALAPLLILVIGGALFRLFTIGSQARRANQEAARITTAAFEQYVQDLRRQEALIGTAIGTRGQPNWGWTNNLMATIASQNPSLRTVSWITAQGRVRASSMQAAIGRDVRDSPPIRQLFAGRTWVASDLLPAMPVSRTVGVVMAHAVRTDAGRLLGIVAAEVDPDALRDVLSRRPPADSVYAVFDRQGHLVASTLLRRGTWEERTRWRTSDRVLRRAIERGRETHGVVRTATLGAAYYAVYHPTASGYIVGVLRPRAEASVAAWRRALMSLLLLLLVTALVRYVTYHIGDTIVDPAHRLREDLEEEDRRRSLPPPPAEAPAEIRDLHAVVTETLLPRLLADEIERRRLHLIFEYLPAGVRYVDAAGEVLLANAVAREMLGEDALGMASTPRGRYTLHRQDGAPIPLADVPLVVALYEGEARRNVEMIIRYTSGEGILALVSATPVIDEHGETIGVVEVAVEVVSDAAALQGIVESTHLEGQLETVRAQLQTLLEIVPVGVFLLDAQGQITSANAESVRLWGGMIPAVNTLGDFRFFHGWWTRTGASVQPDEWPPVRALTRNETVAHEAITLNRFDGLRGNVSTSAAPLRNLRGAIIGAVWIIQDALAPKQP